MSRMTVRAAIVALLGTVGLLTSSGSAAALSECNTFCWTSCSIENGWCQASGDPTCTMPACLTGTEHLCAPYGLRTIVCNNGPIE